MAMDFTREELEDAHLILVVNEEGEYKWSSKRSPQEVMNMLHAIVNSVHEQIRTNTVRNKAKLN